MCRQNKQLAAFILTASVSCVSLTLVVQNARLSYWLRRTQTKDDGEKRINTKMATLFSKVEHKHLTPVAVLAMLAVTSLLYFSMI